MTPKQPRKKLVGVRMPPETLRELAALALVFGTQTSAVIVALHRLYHELQEETQGPPLYQADKEGVVTRLT